MSLNLSDALFIGAPIIGALIAGLLLGLAHFATLSAAVARYVDGRVAVAVALHSARLLVLGGALYGLARLGAGVLLAAALGLLAGRAIVMQRAMEQTP